MGHGVRDRLGVVTEGGWEVYFVIEHYERGRYFRGQERREEMNMQVSIVAV